MKIRVYYEDTDAGGIVYHSKYINFCERARSEILFEKGLSPHSESGFFVVKDIKASFLTPAKLGDMLEVKSELMWVKKASFMLKQTIYRGDEKIFEMDIVLVQVDMSGKIKKIDDKMKHVVDTFNKL